MEEMKEEHEHVSEPGVLATKRKVMDVVRYCRV